MKSDIGTVISLPGWAATHPGVSHAAFRALAVLCLRQAQLGEIDTPTQTELAEDLRISPRQLRRLLLELETAGVLAIEEDGRDRVYLLRFIPDKPVRYPVAAPSPEPQADTPLSLPAPTEDTGQGSLEYVLEHVQRTVHVQGTPHTITRTKRRGKTRRVTLTSPAPRPTVAAPTLRARQMPRFDELYGRWPRQQAREEAKRVAHTLALETDDMLWAQIDRAAAKWIAFWHDNKDPTPSKYIPYLATWLKGKRWLDTVPTATPSYSRQTRTITEATQKFLQTPEEEEDLL